jgi:hypothetical protein
MGAIANEVTSEGCINVSLATQPLVPGTTFTFGDVNVILIFGLSQPPAAWGFTPQNHNSEFYNSGSIVVRLTYKGKSMLFCGDSVGRLIDNPANVCIAAEHEMVGNVANVTLNSYVITASHHGADNGNSTDFVKAVSPKFVIFSAGTKFKHPRAEAAQRYLENGVNVINIFRTDRGDKKRSKESSVGSGTGDSAGDDDVDVLITKIGTLKVAYRN